RNLFGFGPPAPRPGVKEFGGTRPNPRPDGALRTVRAARGSGRLLRRRPALDTAGALGTQAPRQQIDARQYGAGRHGPERALHEAGPLRGRGRRLRGRRRGTCRGLWQPQGPRPCFGAAPFGGLTPSADGTPPGTKPEQ